MRYYDIDMSNMSAVEDILYVKDIQQRKLLINSLIVPETIEDPIRHIMQINREDAGIEPSFRKPIIMYISSDGGDVDSGFSLIDVITASRTPVYTVNIGWQYSMGLLIGLAGHQRYAFKNSKFLMHDGSGMLFDSSSKMQDRMEFQKRQNEMTKEYILERTKLTSEEYDEKLRIEWYLFAEEAKEKGFVDKIIGIDCELDEVI